MATRSERRERALADFYAAFREAELRIASELEDGIRDRDIWRTASREDRLARIARQAEELERFASIAAGRLLDTIRADSAAAEWMAEAARSTTARLLGPARLNIPALDAVVQAYRVQLDTAYRDVRRFVVRHADDAFAEAARISLVQRATGARASRQAGRRDLEGRIRATRVSEAVRGHPALDTGALSLDELVAKLGPRDGYVTAFVDRAGRRWSLSVYADMVTRTTLRAAIVEADIQRMLERGVTVARVSHHANPCKVCGPLEGKRVALDSPTSILEGIPHVRDLPNGGPPFHPNCRHTLEPSVDKVGAWLDRNVDGGVEAIRAKRDAAQAQRRRDAIARVRRDSPGEHAFDVKPPEPPPRT